MQTARTAEIKRQTARGARKGRRKVTFECEAEPGSKVYVAGSFNGWRPDHKQLEQVSDDGLFAKSMMLPPGKHEYKFVVNGRWVADPNCDEWEVNDLGSLNSVVVVE